MARMADGRIHPVGAVVDRGGRLAWPGSRLRRYGRSRRVGGDHPACDAKQNRTQRSHPDGPQCRNRLAPGLDPILRRHFRLRLQIECAQPANLSGSAAWPSEAANGLDVCRTRPYAACSDCRHSDSRLGVSGEAVGPVSSHLLTLPGMAVVTLCRRVRSSTNCPRFRMVLKFSISRSLNSTFTLNSCSSNVSSSTNASESSTPVSNRSVS